MYKPDYQLVRNVHLNEIVNSSSHPYSIVFNCSSLMRAYRLYNTEHLFVKPFRYIVTGKTAAVSDSRPWVKYMILLYAVLFLSAVNGCYGYCTAADEQQGDPQSKVACIAGLRIPIRCSRFGTGRLFLKSSNRIFDSLCHLVYFRLLRNIFTTDNCLDSSFDTGEILVVILVQSIRFGNGCINLCVIGSLCLLYTSRCV